MCKLVPLLLLAVIAAVSTYGHEDTPIPLARGALTGLPKKYQPAFFSYPERKLQIGKLAVTIPPCLWQHFSTAKESEFQFAASWYHEPDNLPHYIHMTAPDAKTGTRIQLLIDLDTLQPMALTRIVEVDPGRAWQHRGLPINMWCRFQWLWSMKPAW